MNYDVVNYWPQKKNYIIMTALSLRKLPFHISGQYRAEVTDTAVCTPDTAVQLISLCCPVLFQARPIDSLNRTSLAAFVYKFVLLVS